LSTTAAGILFAGSVLLALAAVHGPLGDYTYRVFSGTRHSRAERGICRLIGVDVDAEQSSGTYTRSVLAFSVVSVLFLYVFERVQHHLLLSLGFPNVEPALAWNIAVSFTTNTNWQAYSGESTMGHLVQMSGLAVQNFVSAAVGIAVAIAVVRGFARSRTDKLGNFWVDLVRTTIRILLPMSVVVAIVLVAGGAIQNFHDTDTVNTLAGAHQSITGGPVASQEAIKDLGTNGRGFYNANSSHPFENPTSCAAAGGDAVDDRPDVVGRVCATVANPLHDGRRRSLTQHPAADCAGRTVYRRPGKQNRSPGHTSR
jgi:K+-transporting ATPase ATPase A chain